MCLCTGYLCAASRSDCARICQLLVHSSGQARSGYCGSDGEVEAIFVFVALSHSGAEMADGLDDSYSTATIVSLLLYAVAIVACDMMQAALFHSLTICRCTAAANDFALLFELHRATRLVLTRKRNGAVSKLWYECTCVFFGFQVTCIDRSLRLSSLSSHS